MLSLNDDVAQVVDSQRCDDVISWRMQFLSPEDRDLIEAVVLREVPISVVGRLSQTDPQVIRRRVRRLSQRMKSQEFLDAMRALAYLDSRDAKIARLKHCCGFSLRKLCSQLKMTMHETRRALDRVNANIKLINRLSQRISQQVKKYGVEVLADSSVKYS